MQGSSASTPRVAVRPATGKLGILTPGLGAVATTFIAGVESVRRGLSQPIGSLTQMATVRLGKRTEHRAPLIKDFVPLTPLQDIVFGAWDPIPDDAYTAAKKAGVLDDKDLEPLKDFLSSIVPMPAVFESRYVTRLTNTTNVKTGKTKRDLAEQLRQDIRDFKAKNGCERVVAVWCASTETFIKPGPQHATIEQFERVELGVAFGKGGVDLDFALVPVEGSPASDYGRRLSEGAGGLRHLDRIPADSLYAGAWSADPEALAEFSAAYASIMGVEELFGEAYADYMDAWIEAQGASGAMSFDMAIAPDLFARVATLQDPQALPGIFEQGFGVDVRVVQDAADPEAWFRLVEALADDDLFGAEFDELFETAGIGFDIRHASEGSGEGRVDTLGFELRFGPALSAGIDPDAFALTQALLSRIMGKFKLGFAVRDGLALMSTNGRAGIDVLAEGSVSLPASKDPGWRRFLDG
ncbi:MAG TPA: inositol-3-phosphate synthase, partial [Gemmatimonadaceae bacterium]|nr:inositol-3-phosphate synthase [Gemmatimonadaceae bacterium]